MFFLIDGSTSPSIAPAMAAYWDGVVLRSWYYFGPFAFIVSFRFLSSPLPSSSSLHTACVSSNRERERVRSSERDG